MTPETLLAIQTQILEALRVSGRDEASVRMIAVGKGQPQEKIEKALTLGVREFGESRLQEAQRKWLALRAHYPESVLHFIGPLQSNKVREISSLFQVIHSVCKTSHLSALQKVRDDGIPLPQLLLQVNVGREPQKSGVAPEEVALFIKQAHELYDLTFKGMMTIPPAGENPAPYFKMLKSLCSTHGFSELSMGMSADFKEAIQHGATMVRIGSALFT